MRWIRFDEVVDRSGYLSISVRRVVTSSEGQFQVKLTSASPDRVPRPGTTSPSQTISDDPLASFRLGQLRTGPHLPNMHSMTKTR